LNGLHVQIGPIFWDWSNLPHNILIFLTLLVPAQTRATTRVAPTSGVNPLNSQRTPYF
jgi:hypothetical protein